MEGEVTVTKVVVRSGQLTWVAGSLAFMLQSAVHHEAFTSGKSNNQDEGFEKVKKDCLGDGGAAFFSGQEDTLTAKKLLDKTRSELKKFKQKRLDPGSNRSDREGEFTLVEALLNKIGMVRSCLCVVFFLFQSFPHACSHLSLIRLKKRRRELLPLPRQTEQRNKQSTKKWSYVTAWQSLMVERRLRLGTRVTMP